jgi:hypothetical protein
MSATKVLVTSQQFFAGPSSRMSAEASTLGWPAGQFPKEMWVMECGKQYLFLLASLTPSLAVYSSLDLGITATVLND